MVRFELSRTVQNLDRRKSEPRIFFYSDLIGKESCFSFSTLRKNQIDSEQSLYFQMVDINQNDWISYLKLITKWAFVNSQTVLIIKSQQQFPFFTRPKSQKSSYTCAFSLLSNHSVLKWFTRGGTRYLLPLSVQADIFFPSIASQTQKQGA